MVGVRRGSTPTKFWIGLVRGFGASLALFGTFPLRVNVSFFHLSYSYFTIIRVCFFLSRHYSGACIPQGPQTNAPPPPHDFSHVIWNCWGCQASSLVYRWYARVLLYIYMSGQSVRIIFMLLQTMFSTLREMQSLNYEAQWIVLAWTCARSPVHLTCFHVRWYVRLQLYYWPLSTFIC